MDVSNATATSTSVAAIVSNPQAQPPAPQNNKQPEKQPDSTVVKLSEQAQQMSRAENRNAEGAETGSQEAAEPAGIQFMEGESKGGRVNTFA